MPRRVHELAVVVARVRWWPPPRVLSADHPDTTKTLDQLQHCTGKSEDLD
jgi:hypothetical protein